MTAAEAQAFGERLRAAGFRDLGIEVEPVGGRFRSGVNFGKPRSNMWYASVQVRNENERDTLVRMLAEMGVNRQNADVIRDGETFRFTRVPL